MDLGRVDGEMLALPGKRSEEPLRNPRLPEEAPGRSARTLAVLQLGQWVNEAV